MDLVTQIEQGLGTDRLRKLKKNDDNYQIFWVGVLEHRNSVDNTRDPIPYLISCGYGAIANARLSENTRQKISVCPYCGREYSYRYKYCPYCGAESETENRIFSMTLNDGSEIETPDRSSENLMILNLDVERFVQKLYGNEQYVAKRWLIDRADLKYENHCKQIAMELGCSAPYVAQVKKAIREKWQLMCYRSM